MEDGKRGKNETREKDDKERRGGGKRAEEEEAKKCVMRRGETAREAPNPA